MSPAWIAVDWGTTNLRAWAMNRDGSVLAERDSDAGMLRAGNRGFEAHLLELILDWLPAGKRILVLASGMVGARQGWIEAPYAELPWSGAAMDDAVSPRTEDPRIDVRILPGLCQHVPADVMRGEETQIHGFLHGHPGYTGLICLPGTHSKWVRVERGAVAGFHTAMTGELFALLSEQSVLKHSMTGHWDDAAFSGGVSDALQAPKSLTASLFAIRADDLLMKVPTGAGKARLSGLLIGAELAAADLHKQQVALVGSGALMDLYRRALAIVGVEATEHDAGAAARAGLFAAWQSIAGADT